MYVKKGKIKEVCVDRCEKEKNCSETKKSNCI